MQDMRTLNPVSMPKFPDPFRHSKPLLYVILLLDTGIQGSLSKKLARVPAAHGEPRVYPEPAEGNHPLAGGWGACPQLDWGICPQASKPHLGERVSPTPS